MSTWAAEDLERHPLMVLRRCAVYLPNALEHCLRWGGYRCRASAPMIWIAVRACNLARPTGQAPWKHLDIAGTVEDRLERAALFDAGALGFAEPLQPTAERELGTELSTPLHVDVHACKESLRHTARHLSNIKQCTK